VSLPATAGITSGSFRFAPLDRANFSDGRSFQPYRAGCDCEKAAQLSSAARRVIAVVLYMGIINLVYARGRLLTSFYLPVGAAHSASFVLILESCFARGNPAFISKASLMTSSGPFSTAAIALGTFFEPVEIGGKRKSGFRSPFSLGPGSANADAASGLANPAIGGTIEAHQV